MKTNAARILEGLGIGYTLQDYEVDPEDLSAVNVARKIGLPVEQVFKTLLTITGKGPIRIRGHPWGCGVGLQKAGASRRSAQNRDGLFKRCATTHRLHSWRRHRVRREKGFPRLFADETIELFDLISVSAGQRGTQILLAPQDYLRAAKATVADLTKAQSRR